MLIIHIFSPDMPCTNKTQMSITNPNKRKIQKISQKSLLFMLHQPRKPSIDLFFLLLSHNTRCIKTIESITTTLSHPKHRDITTTDTIHGRQARASWGTNARCRVCKRSLKVIDFVLTLEINTLLMTLVSSLQRSRNSLPWLPQSFLGNANNSCQSRAKLTMTFLPSARRIQSEPNY